MSRTIVSLLITLAACTTPDPDTGSAADQDLDWSLCPAYTSLHRVGSQRTFHSTTAWESTYNSTVSSVSTVVSAEEVDGALEVVVEALVDEFLTDGTERHSTDTHTYRCDAEGLWLLSYHRDSGAGWQTMDYTAPLLELPHGLEVGDEWSSDIRYESASHAGTGSPVEATYVYRAPRAETVTTPAGTFDTVVVELVGNGYSVPYHRDTGLGTVLSGGLYELTSFVE